MSVPPRGWFSVSRGRVLLGLELLVALVLLAACAGTSSTPSSSATGATTAPATPSSSTPPATLRAAARPPAVPTTSGTSAATASTVATSTPLSLAGVELLQMIGTEQGWMLTQTAVRRTTDGGHVWTDVTPPAGRATHVDFTTATFATSETGWMAATGAARRVSLYHTTNGGQTWTTTTFGPTVQGDPRTITFVDANHGWVLVSGGAAAGQEAVALFTTTDGGQHWSELVHVGVGRPSDHGLPFAGDKTGIAFRNASTGWMTGHSNGTDPWLYVTHDGGRDWQPQALPLPTVTHVGGSLTTEPPLFAGPQTGVLPVQDGGPPLALRVFVTHDGGQRWTAARPLTYTAPPFPPLTFFLNGSDGWVSNGVTLARTTDGGQTWSQVAANLGWSRPIQLDFVTPQVGWAVVSSGAGTVRLLETTHGGASWTSVKAMVGA